MPNPPPFYSVYRFNWFWRIFARAFLAASALSAWTILRNVILEIREPKPVEMLGGAELTMAGLAMTVHAYIARITFTIEAFEHRTIFASKCLPWTKSAAVVNTS